MDKRKREMEELSKYLDLCPDKPDFDTHGVLLSDEIEHYVKKYKMIDPFDKECLKPAAYELRVGYEYALGGKIDKLSDDSGKDRITIPPFQVAIINTIERINLPRFIIGRWNIRVRKAYEGLLWVGGPQVDPGYLGYLRCPIFNLSNKDVTLRLGEHIAIIDFVKTTPFTKGCQPYPRPPSRILFEDYNPENLQSALFHEASTRIKRIESEMDDRNNKIEQRMNRVEQIAGIMFTSIAILFAGLSVLVTSASVTKSESLTAPYFFWTWFSVGLSILALVFSTYNYFYRKARDKGNRK